MGRALKIGEVVGDRYRVEEFIGYGGMSAVYRVMDQHLGETLALKVIASDATNAALSQRFDREVAAMIRVSQHPHAVTITDRGTRSDGSPFLVMQYIDGYTLAEVMQGRTGDVRWLADRLQGVARALDFAAGMGVIHRDVKPSNILVGLDEHAYLTDFGIAQIADATRLTTGFPPMTVAYSSPEQVLNKPVTPRTDQFSLACLVFQGVTGELPFGAADDRLDGLADEWARELAPHGEGLWTSFARALQPDPSERFSSCAEFLREVSASVSAKRSARIVRQYEGGTPPATAVSHLSSTAATLTSDGRDIAIPGENPPRLSWLIGARRANAVAKRIGYVLQPSDTFKVDPSGEVSTPGSDVIARLSAGQWWPGFIEEADPMPREDFEPLPTDRPPDGFRGHIAQVAAHHWPKHKATSLVPHGDRFQQAGWEFTGFRQVPCPRCSRSLADLTTARNSRQNWHCYYCPSCGEGFVPSELGAGNRYLPAHYRLTNSWTEQH